MNSELESKEKVDQKEEGMYGIKDSVVFLVGNMIGAGIFMSPEIVAKCTKNEKLALLAWFIAGCIALFGAICYIELGVLFPENGGEGIYLTEGIHPFFGMFYYYASIFLTIPGALAIMTEKIVECFFYGFLIKQTPKFALIWIQLASIFVLFLLTLVNIFCPKISSNISQGSIMAKVISIAWIIITGTICMLIGRRDNWTHQEVQSTGDSFKKISNLCFILFAALWSYDGWNSMNIIGGRVKNPKRTFPISIIISIPLVMILYIILNWLYLYVIPSKIFLEDIQNQPEKTKQITFASISLIDKLFPNWISLYIFPLFVSMAIVGSVNGCFICGAFVILSSAEKGFYPKCFNYENKKGSPVYGFIQQFLLAVFYLLFKFFGDKYNYIFSIVNIFMWIFYGFAALSVLVFRVKKQKQKREFKVWTPLPVFFSLVALTFAVVGITSFIVYGKETENNPFA